MKRTSTLLKNGIVLSLLTSTLLHATNGDNLIAVGAKARGMGGTGIAVSHGAESTLSNPAMITSIEGTEISFGGTLFMPKIDATISGAMLPSQINDTSAADTNIIPEVSIAHKINDNWYIGAGMFGTAGMGVDYRDSTLNPMVGQFGNFNMVTNLQLLQFAIPVAYKYEGFSVAVAPILQYGNLDINYKMPNPMTGAIDNIGSGLAQDFGFGFTAGASYDFNNGLVVGAMYKSAIEMEYDKQITTAMAPFTAQGIPLGNLTDKLEQPAEYGVGIAYTMEGHTIALDYKKIEWSSATGYGDFGWEDQNVFAVGYQFTQDNWAIRLGYNYAESAIVNLTETGNGVASSLNFFNALGFPANAEQHYTFGGTYDLTDAFGIDLAYVYSPTSDIVLNTPAFSRSFGIDSLAASHQENSISVQLTYKF